MFSKRIAISLGACLAAACLFLVTKDEGAFVAVRWLIVLFGLSFCLRPLMPVNRLSAQDDCFGMGVGFGLGLSFFISYIIGSVFNLPFNTIFCYVCVLFLCALSVIAAFKKRAFYVYSADGLYKYLKGYIIFILVFFAAFWCIGFNPVVDSGTENYMDYGFMTSIFRQESFKPVDFWFAGEKLNYYYLGQAAAVFMTRLAFTTPEYGYNLMLCTFIAVVFCASAEIAEGFVRNIAVNKPGVSSKVAGIFAGSVAAFSGNFVWVIYGIIVPLWQKITGNVFYESEFWFSDPTVYISTYLGDFDNGKNEFPAYSVILGDLHAHVVDLMFTLPFIAMVMDYLFTKKEEEKKSIYRYAVMGVMLSLFKGSNYWDFAIFYVICGAIIVFKNFADGGFTKENILTVCKAALIITAVSYVAALPFTLSFKPISSKICFATNHSPFDKLLVLWGFPVIVILGLLFNMLVSGEKHIIQSNGVKMGLTAFMMCAFGLIAVPEVVYVEDIYGESNARFNTMFKLTYAAFVLFAIIIGIAAGILVEYKKGLLLGMFGFVCFLLCLYTPFSAVQWQGRILHPYERKCISSIKPLYDKENYEFETDVYKVLLRDNRKDLVVLECSGDSYSHENAVSVLSGAQTVAGWFVHEWLWRDDSDLINNRRIEVTKFFESGDNVYCRDFLKKYKVDYIVVGPAESSRYSVDYAGFEEFGEVVYKANYDDMSLQFIRVDKEKL